MEHPTSNARGMVTTGRSLCLEALAVLLVLCDGLTGGWAKHAGAHGAGAAAAPIALAGGAKCVDGFVWMDSAGFGTSNRTISPT